MKTKYKLFTAIFVCILIFIVYQSQQTNIEDTKDTSSDISLYLESISLDDYNELKNNQESFFVYVNNNSCSDCQIFNVQLLKELQTNESLHHIKFLDMTSLHSNKPVWNSFKNENKIEGTPSFIFIKHGSITSTYGWTIEHDIKYKVFIEWFNNLNNNL